MYNIEKIEYNGRLKSCPFCGKKAYMYKGYLVTSEGKKYDVTFFVRCETGSMNELERDEKGICLGNSGWWSFDTAKDAARAWNKRVKVKVKIQYGDGSEFAPFA